jgi:hypothetical protein
VGVGLVRNESLLEGPLNSSIVTLRGKEERFSSWQD